MAGYTQMCLSLWKFIDIMEEYKKTRTRLDATLFSI